MARNLATKPNVEPADAEYPFGRIKDNPGNNTGTPVNEEVYGDIHQFFAKIMSDAGIAYNGLPDNAYDGFQYRNALFLLIQRNGLAQFVFAAGAPPGGTITGRGYYVDTSTGNIYEAVNSPYSQIMFGWLPSAWVEVGSGGGAPAFQNSWNNLSVATPARYRKTPSGLITLDGLIEGGANGTVVFTLPTGFRPTKQTLISAFGQDGGGDRASVISIATNGNVSISSTAPLSGGVFVQATLNGNFYNS